MTLHTEFLDIVSYPFSHFNSMQQGCYLSSEDKKSSVSLYICFSLNKEMQLGSDQMLVLPVALWGPLALLIFFLCIINFGNVTETNIWSFLN